MSDKISVTLQTSRLTAGHDVLPLATSLSSREIGWNGLLVEKAVQPPHECPIPPLTQHLITVYVGAPNPVWQKRDGRTLEATLREGSINIMPAGQASEWRWQQSLETIYLYLDPVLLSGIADQEGRGGRVEIVSAFNLADPQIRHIAAALLAPLSAGSLPGRLYGESLSIALASHLLHFHTASPSPFPSPSGVPGAAELQRAIAFIRDDLSADLSLTEIASAAGYSSYYFARLFKQTTGQTPHQYVLACRVEKARQLLVKGKLSVSQVAALVGFSDSGHLARQLKRRLGVTPSDLLPHKRNIVP